MTTKWFIKQKDRSIFHTYQHEGYTCPSLFEAEFDTKEEAIIDYYDELESDTNDVDILEFSQLQYNLILEIASFNVTCDVKETLYETLINLENLEYLEYIVEQLGYCEERSYFVNEYHMHIVLSTLGRTIMDGDEVYDFELPKLIGYVDFISNEYAKLGKFINELKGNNPVVGPKAYTINKDKI